MGGPKGAGPEGVGPEISRFFPLPLHVSLFFSFGRSSRGPPKLCVWAYLGSFCVSTSGPKGPSNRRDRKDTEEGKRNEILGGPGEGGGPGETVPGEGVPREKENYSFDYNHNYMHGRETEWAVVDGHRHTFAPKITAGHMCTCLSSKTVVRTTTLRLKAGQTRRP